MGLSGRKKKILAAVVEEYIRTAEPVGSKTVAQTAAATIGTAVMISEVDWRMVVSAALLAGALSLLTSVAGLPEAQEK